MVYTLDSIKEACFELAVALSWEKENRTSDNIATHVNELAEMTDSFFHLAEEHLDYLFDLENKEEVLVRAIQYLEDAHAIPPLKFNDIWFDYSLRTLVEILKPNGIIRKSNLVFLQLLENGIKVAKQDIADENKNGDEQS